MPADRMVRRFCSKTLGQPGLIEDPITREWRGATDEDWEEWAEEES
jgi:hypothetical protein